MKYLACSVLSLLSLISLPASGWEGDELDSGLNKSGLAIRREGDIVAVTIDGESFTNVHLAGFRRPILYPVLGPHQTPMTRKYPMEKGVDGEADDHPHHKSIWCGHGLINGVSFWSERGKIAVDTSKPVHMSVAANGKQGSVTFSCKYLSPEDELICTDLTTLTFHDLGDARAIDWDVTLRASEGNVVFGDTKEGMMATRTHPSLRIDKGATAVNSAGGEGKGIWGKPAQWVDYSATVEGQHVGVAIFDHPDNLRHPTTWHARDYGLVAANPFGKHHFLGEPLGAGEHQLERGEEIRFRYRFVFHQGNVETGKISQRYAAFAAKSD